MTREPGDLPGRRHPSGVRGARMGRFSAVVAEGPVERPGATAMRCRVQRCRPIGRAAIAKMARVTWTAAFLAAAPAMAAEMAVKAPWQAPIVQAYDWTGLYVGAHIGYAWGHSNMSTPAGLATSLPTDPSSSILTASGMYLGALQITYTPMQAN